MGHFFVRCFNIVSHFVVSYNNFLSLYLVCMYTRCISLVRYTREKKYRSGSRFCFISKSLLMLQLTIEPDRFNGQQIIPYLHQLWDVLRHYGSGPSHHPRIRQIIMTFNAQHVLMNVELPSIIFHYINMNITTCIFRQCRKRTGIDSRHRRFEATSVRIHSFTDVGNHLLVIGNSWSYRNQASFFFLFAPRKIITFW